MSKFKLFDVMNGDMSSLNCNAYGFDADTTIVRYISAERYLAMIESGKGFNELSLVTRWDDPYEAFLLRNRSAQTESLYSSLQRYYGQSWMLKCPEKSECVHGNTCESDILWRAYCPNRDGVRVETTVGQLLKFFKRNFKDDAEGFSVCIGRISYLPKNQVMRLCDNGDGDGDALMESLFVKRVEFAVENEIRIVLNAPHDFVRSCNGGSVTFEHGGCRVQGCDFIESVLVDPRMPRHRAEEIICRSNIAFCAEKTGKTNVKVERSTLYEWAKFDKKMMEIVEAGNKCHGLWVELKARYRHDETINFSQRAIPYDSYWSGIPSCKPGCCFAFVCNRKVTRVEFFIGRNSRDENKQIFERLQSRRNEIEEMLRKENLLNEQVDYDPLENKISSRIFIQYCDVTSGQLNERKDDIIKWFCRIMPPFARAINAALTTHNDPTPRR